MRTKTCIIGAIAAATFVGIVAGRFCQPHSTPPSDYLHLHAVGGWGIDGDIWIFPDDTFRCRWVHSGFGKLDKEHTGRSAGLFSRLVKLVSDEHAWEMSTASLKRDVRAASHGDWPFVYDATHHYLDFRAQGHGVLTADFYAAGVFSRHLPEAKQLAAFDRLLEAIYKETN